MDHFPSIVPVLKTQRLVLREMTDSDIPAFQEIVNFRQDRPPRDPMDVLMKTREDFAGKRGLNWAIECDGTFIGTIGYYRGFEHETGEVGYVLRSPYRRKGYMSEALKEALLFGFKHLKLRMITAFTQDINEGGVSLLNAFGFKRTEELWEDYRRYEITLSELESH